jgi:hypothetical protein
MANFALFFPREVIRDRDVIVVNCGLHGGNVVECDLPDKGRRQVRTCPVP